MHVVAYTGACDSNLSKLCLEWIVVEAEHAWPSGDEWLVCDVAILGSTIGGLDSKYNASPEDRAASIIWEEMIFEGSSYISSWCLYK